MYCCMKIIYVTKLISINNKFDQFFFLSQICQQNPFSRKHYNFKKQLPFVITSKLLLKWLHGCFFALTWQIFQIIVDVLSLVVFARVFNQSKGHWLLSNVLNFIISICLKLKEDTWILVFFDNFIEQKSIVILELDFLTLEKRFEVFFKNKLWKKYEEKKAHNIMFLMLDPRFKNLCLVPHLLTLSKAMSLLMNMIKKALYLMLLKCYHHLHSLFKNAIVD